MQLRSSTLPFYDIIQFISTSHYVDAMALEHRTIGVHAATCQYCYTVARQEGTAHAAYEAYHLLTLWGQR